MENVTNLRRRSEVFAAVQRWGIYNPEFTEAVMVALVLSLSTTAAVAPMARYLGLGDVYAQSRQGLLARSIPLKEITNVTYEHFVLRFCLWLESLESHPLYSEDIWKAWQIEQCRDNHRFMVLRQRIIQALGEVSRDMTALFNLYGEALRDRIDIQLATGSARLFDGASQVFVAALQNLGTPLDSALPVREHLYTSEADSLLGRTIFALELPPQTEGALIKHGICYIGQLIQLSEVNLLELRFVGQVGVAAIRRSLAERGLQLAIILPEWESPHEAMRRIAATLQAAT